MSPHVSIEWIGERLRRGYREQPRFGSGEQARKDERSARSALRPRSENVSIFPSLSAELEATAARLANTTRRGGGSRPGADIHGGH